MPCQEIAFADALCRVEVAERTHHPDMPLFVARLWLVAPDYSATHPLVSGDDEPVEIHAPTEALALNSAITFLATRFGSLSEYPHRCVDFADPPAGAPISIDRA